MRKVYKIITNIILTVLIVIVALLFAPRIFGLTPLAVLSGSMEPTYHVGSVIYIEKPDPEDIQVGDAITFTISDDSTMVTHRVVEKNEQEKYFKTKGDANDVEDGGEVLYSSVVGKPVFTIPLLGFAAAYAATKSGLIILITLIVVVLILTFLPDMLLKEEKDGKDDNDGNTGGVK